MSTASDQYVIPKWVLVLGFLIFGPLIAMGPRLSPGALVYAALVVIPLLAMNWKEVCGFVRKPAVIFAALTVIYSCASMFWSPSPRALGMAIDMAYLSLCGVMVAAAFRVLPAPRKPPYAVFFTLSIVIGLAVLAEEFYLNYPIHRWWNTLPDTASLGENITKRALAIFSLLIWPAAAWLEKKRGRTAGVALLFMFMFFLLSATSRSASVGMLMGASAFVLAFMLPMFVRLALMTLVIMGLLLTVPAAENASKLPTNITEKLFESAQARLDIWEYTAKHVAEAPIFGHGIDASRGLETTVSGERAKYLNPGTNIISLHPHNVFLQLWLDFGAVGAAMWGALMLMLLQSIKHLARNTQAYALGAATCALVMLCTTFSPLQAWWATVLIETMLLFALRPTAHLKALKQAAHPPAA
jgi:O-antigen ligase